jgi:hypothetical protein
MRPPVPGLPALPATTPPQPAPPAPCCGAGNSLVGGPPACAPFEDRNGPLLYGDPLLDNCCCFPPGWIADLELPIVAPHLRNNLVDTVTVGPRTGTIHVPTAKLDWTVAPRFEVGYRLPEAAGDLLVSYRFLTTTGTDTLPAFDAAGNPGLLRSRLIFNVLDLDYAHHESSLGPDWDMRWWAGIRFADVYFDSSAASAALSQSESNTFYGVGPHAGLEVQRRLGTAGLELFARADGAMVFGQVRQRYTEAVSGPGGETAVNDRFSHTQPVPYMALQAGVVWRPPQEQRLSVALGYTIERWWEVGELLTTPPPGSKGELTVQGVYLRFGWSY